MGIIDDYLDGYLAKKVIYLLRGHYGEDIEVEFSPDLKIYDVSFKQGGLSYPLMSFSKGESLIVLRKLLARGWQSWDEKLKQIKEQAICKEQ